MKIRYFRHEVVDTPYGSTDEHGYITVTDEQAGRPPDPRRHEASLELRAAMDALDYPTAEKLAAEIEGLDRGSGFLAQNVWSAPKPKTDSKEGDK